MDKFLDKLYRIYGILIVASFFLLPVLAWGWWGLLIGVFEVFAFGYAEALFGVSKVIGQVVLTLTSGLALFIGLPKVLFFSATSIPLVVALIYVIIVFTMYWSKSKE